VEIYPINGCALFPVGFAKAEEEIFMKGMIRSEETDNRSISGCKFARQHSGFSLIELLIILMIACLLAGFGVMGMTGILPGMRSNEAMNVAVSQLRRGRSLAISQRRSVQLQFLGDNQIRLVRNNWPPPGTTELSRSILGNNSKFISFSGVPDTPDLFGNSSAVNFGDAVTLTFLSDGTLVDDSGDPVNGTIFLGEEGHPEVARAVTVLGTTGRIRGYRWTGTKWIQ
jgi:Tfp pilus assembly protein FimT